MISEHSSRIEQQINNFLAYVKNVEDKVHGLFDSYIFTGKELRRYLDVLRKVSSIQLRMEVELNGLKVLDGRAGLETPLFFTTFDSTPLPMTASAAQHLPGPLCICIQSAILAERPVIKSINLLASERLTAFEAAAAVHVKTEDNKLHYQFNIVRPQTPTTLEFVTFHAEITAQQTSINGAQAEISSNSEHSPPLIVMAAVCAQWEKANLKLLEHFLFSSGTAQPDQISVNRFFNSLQLVVNSVARHWKYEPRIIISQRKRSYI
jgi:hypothetical protein